MVPLIFNCMIFKARFIGPHLKYRKNMFVLASWCLNWYLSPLVASKFLVFCTGNTIVCETTHVQIQFPVKNWSQQTFTDIDFQTISNELKVFHFSSNNYKHSNNITDMLTLPQN